MNHSFQAKACWRVRAFELKVRPVRGLQLLTKTRLVLGSNLIQVVIACLAPMLQIWFFRLTKKVRKGFPYQLLLFNHFIKQGLLKWHCNYNFCISSCFNASIIYVHKWMSALILGSTVTAIDIFKGILFPTIIAQLWQVKLWAHFGYQKRKINHIDITYHSLTGTLMHFYTVSGSLIF